MKRFWINAVLFLAIGWFLGAASGLLFHRWKPRPFGPPSSEHVAQRFSRDLALTSEQTAKLRTILADKRVQMDSIRNASRVEFERIREATRTEIQSILTPEQQGRFEQIEAKRKKRFTRAGGRAGARGDENRRADESDTSPRKPWR